MFRILMVEDDEKTRRHFRETLIAEMPDAEMIEAASVPEAEREIENQVLQGTRCDAVILDYRLPSYSGTYEMNTSLCPLVSRKWPTALVIHWTAFAEDPQLVRHYAQSHADDTAPAKVVAKTGPWDVALIRVLVNDRVRRGLLDFFGTNVGVAAGRSRRVGSSGRLARLIADIERFWKLLPDDTREMVLQDFNVTEEKEGIRAELGGKA